MAQIYNFPHTGATGDFQPVGIPRKKCGPSTIPGSVNDSIIRMFHDCGLGVRKIASVYRRVYVNEKLVEELLRAHHREAMARMRCNSLAWRAA